VKAIGAWLSHNVDGFGVSAMLCILALVGMLVSLAYMDHRQSVTCRASRCAVGTPLYQDGDCFCITGTATP
jgi:hypothetical protein